MPLLQIDQLSKSFQTAHETIQVLSRVTLSIPEAFSISILGKSGSGKSTFLNLLGGLDRPDEGSILFEGNDITKFSEKDMAKYRQRTIGFIFQYHYMFKDLTAVENVVLPARIAKVPMKQAYRRAEELFEFAGLSRRQKHFPYMLSGGERQRVAIIRALALRPRLVLADEPTGNLDDENRSRIAELLFSLPEQFRATLILVTHDHEMSQMAKERFVLQNHQFQAKI